MFHVRKVVVIGCGFVGSATAFALMQSGIFSEMALIDVDKKKAEGEAMDIGDGIPFSRPMKIYAGDYDDVSDAAMVIITAGANQKPEETRLDLVHKNVHIFEQIVPEIKKRDFGGLILVVANPVDILTYVTWKLSGLPKNRVLGSGTVLDTARLKCVLGEVLEVDARSVHAFVIGEHGDSELPVFSSANVSGIDLEDYYDVCYPREYETDQEKIHQEVKDSAYRIIENKKATYYGVAMAVKRICECIAGNEHSILTVSSVMDGHYGVSDMALSMPAVVGATGIERIIEIDLNQKEKEALDQSVTVLHQVISDMDY